MATNGVQQQQYPQQAVQQQQTGLQQSQSSPHHCKECGLYLNSAESLEVHLQYHKENLLNKWATQAASSHSEENNNTKGSNIKREFVQNSVAPADSSDTVLKKSPEYGSRATPDTSVNFGHPPTPQSYQSASSPYQNPSDNSSFSPSFQNYQPIKQERSSPAPNFQQQQQNYTPYSENQFYNVDSPSSQSQQNYHQDYLVHKMNVQNSNFRYQPYGNQHSSYDRNGHQPHVTSSSPAYPAQPTPSPSPKQCDKCGFVCESATQLIEHLNVAHPPTPYQQSQFMFSQQPDVKTEEEAQSEILDLDSHKVHQVYQEEEKRQNGELNGHNPHSVSAMLGNWSTHHQQKLFQDQRMFMNGPENKMFPNGLNDTKMFQQDPKMYAAPNQQPMHSPDYMANSVSTTSHEGNNGAGMQPQLPYRPFEHLPQSSSSVISSTQVPNASTVPSVPNQQKSTNWKSNEARRPKTYNCTACNKWFTSSGHLKRHYNTTLHKNAVKSSGQPDPASLPISAHHHPARESTSSREDRGSSSPGEESRSEDSLPPSFDRPGPMQGLLQQPPNGPYDRQPAPNINLHHPPLHSPMGHNPNPALSNISGTSPPNGEAGPSVTATMDSRGLLSIHSNNTAPTTAHGFNMPPMMPMDNAQFQMYPNGSAPHVTQDTAITSSPNTTGELLTNEFINAEDLSPNSQHEPQPLPSFAALHGHRYGVIVSYGDANVGGLGPVTAPFSYYTSETFDNQEKYVVLKQEDDYRLTVMTSAEPALEENPYSPVHDNIDNKNNNNDINGNNNNIKNLAVLTKEKTKFNSIDDIIDKKLNQTPKSPEKSKKKRDFEQGITSPSITSTVQSKQPSIHKCFDCDKVFNKSCYLTQHNKTFHSGEKPFKCSRCGKRFSCESQFKEHHSKHAGEKPHKCELCPKQFNHKTDLRRHMCLHTGQKPFACGTCGKGFIRKDHMLKHCETHTRRPHNAKMISAIR